MALDKRGSGPRPVPGRRAVVPGSGRMQPAQEPQQEAEHEHGLPPPPRRLATASQRHVPKRPQKNTKELLIAASVLGVLGVIVFVSYMWRSAQWADSENKLQAQTAIMEKNLNLAQEEFDKANATGLKFVMGLEEKAADDTSLFAPFQGNDKIYNVIYDQHFMSKKGEPKQDYRQLFTQPERSKIITFSFAGLDEEAAKREALDYKYGWAQDHTVPVVVVTKVVLLPEDSKVNTGGAIIVVVKADGNDPKFEQMKTAKPLGEQAAAPTSGGQ